MKKKYLLGLLSILIVFFVSSAMYLHKVGYEPIVYEVVLWAIAVALFLCFEIVLHLDNRPAMKGV